MDERKYKNIYTMKHLKNISIGKSMNEYPLKVTCVYFRANAYDFNRHVFKEFACCIIRTLYDAQALLTTLN